MAGATFLLNSPYPPDVLWAKLPAVSQAQIVQKQLKVYCINASKVAREAGMGGRINTVMQVCFFALAGVLPRAEAIAQIKASIRKTYGKKGEDIVQMNLKAVDATLDHLHSIPVPEQGTVPVARATLPGARHCPGLCQSCPRADDGAGWRSTPCECLTH